MLNWKAGASSKTLISRAKYLKRIRDFFEKNEILEVETPSISEFPTIDLHLESFSLADESGPTAHYLITSPEYHMKRLLCEGVGSIFQICKSFRKNDFGRYHNAEFTIIEWYRVGWDHWQLMNEIELLLDDLLDCGNADRISYQSMFQHYLCLDPFSMEHEDLIQVCQNQNITLPDYLNDPASPKDEWLNFLMGALIESQLGKDKPVFVFDYPSSQASLARICPENPMVSQRFELFFKGLEIGNGFFELNNPKEQRRRFNEENQKRIQMNKKPLPIDHRFLSALEEGLPDCAGVALGFDRIMMLALGITHMDQMISFSWKRC